MFSSYLCVGFIVLTYLDIIGNHAQNLNPSDQPEAYFNGSAYVRLQTTISLNKFIGISFRTCTGGGLFSQSQNDNLLKVSVGSEGVVFTAKTAGTQYEKKVIGNFLNNKWHTVQMQYRLGNLTIQVDKKIQLIANASYQSELLTSPSLYDEGAAAVLLIGTQYIGCLLEGPSLVFDKTVITSSPNVIFGHCPLPADSCLPIEYIKGQDFCEHEPCMRQGTCINGQKGYTCSCLPRYSGKNCEIDLGDPCEKETPPCKNGGICMPDSSGEYTCKCLSNFTGRHCETEVIPQKPCQKNPCMNGAECIESEGTKCVCLPGFTGSICELNIDECTSNVCKNGGVCIDGMNNYTCDCTHTGYAGDFCEININECVKNPCLNQGTCFDTYGSYLCQCAPGFGGPNCQLNQKECISQPCVNHGTCMDTENGYKCHCLPGFSGLHCEHESRLAVTCDSNTCSPYAECLTAGNSVQCICKAEFPGIYPNCTVDNVCVTNPCKNGGKCQPWKNSFNCTCPPGFTGSACERADFCKPSTCRNGGTCLNGISTYRCICYDGWAGPICETHLQCANNPCEHYVGCQDFLGGYYCTCQPGWTGLNCNVDIGLCSSRPCYNGATCLEHTDFYSCQCAPGYSGPSCEVDIDECKIQSDICNEGICVNIDGGFQCYCKPGYTGETCDLDFDECLSKPCYNNASCINLINNFECKCPPGYKGKDCSINIDECAPMPCKESSTCVDGINEFTCYCELGFTGKVCDINIDDCESSPCLNGAECIDEINNYTCNCNDTGYIGPHCEHNIDDCIDNPCMNGGQCEDGIKDYDCKCYPAYIGKNCQEDINECLDNPCQHSGICLERSNVTLYRPNSLSYLNATLPESFHKPFDYASAAGYECLCVQGVTGKNCEIDINECESSPCMQGTCDDRIGGYVCDCEEGFEGERCETDIDECELYKPCVHGKCIDKRANYFCDCDPDYGGQNCSVELIGCHNNPCQHNGTCKPYLMNENQHKFNCSCPSGYHGQTCGTISTMSLNGKSLIMVNTTREEGYDIQFRFKTTLGDGLLALGNGLTYYILELSKGRLNLQSSLLNKWEGVYIGSNLNDSQWQRIFVAINSTHLVLSANDEQTIYPITINENYNATSFPTTYIGGIPKNLEKLTRVQPYLVGCTEDVLVNGEWVLPEKNESPSVTLHDVGSGCSRKPQCKPNPCYSGGHCTDLWVDFSCTCERPYLGSTCQYNYTAATFGYENITDSLVKVTVGDSARRAVRTIVDISMFIKTRQQSGQIFYLGSLGSANLVDDTYIAAELEGGELLVRIQFNGTPESYTVGGVKLNNGYNHLIEVIRNVTLVQVKLNGTEYFRKTISATGTLDAQVLFMGGQPQIRSVRQANDNLIKMDVNTQAPSAPIMKPLNQIHFKGIIQDVQISNGSSVMVVEFFPLQADDLEIPPSFGTVSFDKSTVLDGIYSDNSCRINPCVHGGTCDNTWNDYRCQCPRGFKGKNCTDLEFCEIEHCPIDSICNNLEDGYECLANATFDGKSPPLKYKLVLTHNSTKPLFFDSLELTYRSRSWGTIFFATYEKNYFVIFVYHSEIVVEWRLNNIVDNQRFKKDDFEGQWLSLYFMYAGNMFKGGFKEAVMDESPSFEVTNFDFATFSILIQNGMIYLAGSDGITFDYQTAINSTDYNSLGYVSTSDTTTMTSNSLGMNEIDTQSTYLLKILKKGKENDFFKGCIGKIRIGGLLLPFFTKDELYSSSSNSYSNEIFHLLPVAKPQIGCVLCYNTDCFNKGYCANPSQTYECTCTEGYTDDDCSVDINECETNECQNNSTCIDLEAKYECKCLTGYEGLYCENDIDECLSNPCRHNGTCLDLVGKFKCECPEGFVGKQCETLITCEHGPCMEGSTCVTGANKDTGNNFTCFCAEGMEGPLCRTPFCEKKRCERGNCRIRESGPFCDCERGFDGKFCEQNVDDCVSPAGGSPCQNGGVCIDGINRYDCNCSETGYTGLLCEMDIDECTSKRGACGKGICGNLPGTYRCSCEERGKCGHFCSLDDPCEIDRPCAHGECVSKCLEKSDYICVCHERYTGRNCTNPKVAASQSEDGINILFIVIPIVLIILIAFGIGMIILVNVARSKRATRGTYSPSAQEFCNPRVELDHVLKPPPEERLI